MSSAQIDAILHEEPVEGEAGISCDLEHAWSELNYIFCGDDKDVFPNNFIMGGKPLLEDDSDCVSPTYYSPEEVETISQYLNSLDRETLLLPFAKLNGKDHEMDEFECCYSSFEDLRDFFQEVVETSDCIMVVWY